MHTLTKVSAAAGLTTGATPVLAPTCFAELVQFAQMAAKSQLEPGRVCRRLVGLSYAAKAISCNWA
jgi:hypothetical protein